MTTLIPQFDLKNGGSTPAGAVNRPINKKLAEFVSVLDFGAIGDGVTDDSAAIQAALNSASALYFPVGNYFIGTTLTLPYANFVMRGEGRLSRIFGSVNPLVAYPTTTGSVTQCIYQMSFEATSSNTCINMTQTWDSAGKIGPRIEKCYFLTSLASDTSATAINLSGVWTADIVNNQFTGNVTGSTPSTRVGGYGIKIVLGNNMNTSVMNINVYDNEFLSVAYPFYCPGRSSGGTGAGRVEGLSFQNNSFVNGNTAITTVSTLATNISNNIISDYNVAINSNSDFDFVIVGNAEVDGASVGIKFDTATTGILERGIVTGNYIAVRQAGVGIQFNTNNGSPRSIVISGNFLGRTDDAVYTGTGIQVTGSNGVQALNINGNGFQQMLTAIDVGSVAGQSIIVNANTYVFVTNTGSMQSTSYNLTIVVTIAGGVPSEVINISIPVGIFTEPPVNGFLTEDGTSGTPIIGFFRNNYVDSGTTTTNARFEIFVLTGGNIAAGAHRFNLQLNGY